MLPVLLILVPAAYLSLWPVPIEPLAWQAPAAPGYVGAHAPNSRLAGVRQIDLKGEVGPEHVVFGADGLLYTGVASGHILRMKPDGGAQEVFCDTGGKPLGMAFDAAGRLIVADAVKGLLSIGGNGKATVLVDAVAGEPLRFLDGVVVAGNGKIYFTDASTRFGPAQWGGTLQAATLDVLEQSSTGRVLEYDPARQAARVVAKGLSFANGIALSGDQASLLVSESGRYRVWKIAVAAEQLDVARPSAQARVLLDNLPGYPDNLQRGLDGRIWLGLAGQRNDLDKMAGRPFLRKLMLRVPRPLWPTPKPYGHVIAFDEDGRVLADLQDASGNSPLTTGATETAQRLYIHNADGKSLGWLAR
ncbi:SMP-30/gluconolactonase/LRE family protein [Rugamonas sp. CCM 8940]|uniref:SMP-30/gluconolactonase/LRE family protein n=1 Tax=Rugamonas sp. CCM 8940 TaxID=2765359 RepID=UPI00351C8345